MEVEDEASLLLNNVQESLNTAPDSTSDRTTPMNSTPYRLTPSLGSAKFKRVGGSRVGSRVGSSKSTQSLSENGKIQNKSFHSLLRQKLLVTQTSDDEDDDEFDFRNGRLSSRDDDYETDLEMDYDKWIAEDEGVLDEDADLDKKYIDVCNKTGIIPVTYFIKHIDDYHFRMRYHGLGSLGAKAISQPLKESHHIKVLDLEGNWIGAEGAQFLAEMLKENIYISELNIAENKIGREGAEAICEMLYKNDTLSTLNLAGNDLEDYGAVKVCDMLQKNSSLKRLNLSNNKFEERGAMCLKEALSSNEILESLDLSWNHIRANGAIAIAEGVQENFGLKYLNLSMNGFGEKGAEAIGKALKNNRGLLELDLSHNRVSEEGAGYIAMGLQVNDALKVLKIGHNSLGIDGPLALLVGLSKNDVSCMMRLDLSGIHVSPEFKDIQAKLERERMFTVNHAGVLKERENFDKINNGPLETFRRDPFGKVKKYADEAGYRLIDLFKDFDKDGNMMLTAEEFTEGIKAAGVPITMNEIKILLERLDENNDGHIDFGELMRGDKEFRKLKMEEDDEPEERKMQRGANRIETKQSDVIDAVLGRSSRSSHTSHASHSSPR